MFVVICIKPDAFLSDPNQHIFDRCSNKKLCLFETAKHAEHYVRKQQILSKKHFLIIPFSSDLQDALNNCDSQQFYKHMQEPTYFLPHATHRGTKIHFVNEHKLINEDESFIREQAQPVQEVVHIPNPLPVPVPAQVPIQVPPIQPLEPIPERFVPMRIKAPVRVQNSLPEVDLKAFEKLPDNFLLGSSLIEDIKKNSLNDPVQFDEYSLDELGKIACYRTANGYYQLYTMMTIQELLKHSVAGNSFKDPLTGENINIKNVRALTPELLKEFLKQHDAKMEPIQENTSMSLSRG
jgi:hypothetical protein